MTEPVAPVAWRWCYLYPGRENQWVVCQTPRHSSEASSDCVAIEAEPLFSQDAIEALQARVVEAVATLETVRHRLSSSAAVCPATCREILDTIDAALANQGDA